MGEVNRKKPVNRRFKVAQTEITIVMMIKKNLKRMIKIKNLRKNRKNQ